MMLVSRDSRRVFAFTARRYASAVYAVVVCLSVRLPQAGIVPKWLNIASPKQRCMIAQGLVVF